MWRAKAGYPAAAILVPNVDVTSLQLCLAAFRMPLPAHVLFNALAALGALLLGHPWAAAVLLVAATAFDTAQQHLVKRWLAAGPELDEHKGLRRLAALSAVRMTVYTLPTWFMAFTGGLAELAFYGLQLATLMAVAVGLSSLSRLVFWASVSPMAESSASARSASTRSRRPGCSSTPWFCSSYCDRSRSMPPQRSQGGMTPTSPRWPTGRRPTRRGKPRMTPVWPAPASWPP